jgi:hypothetical protein
MEKFLALVRRAAACLGHRPRPEPRPSPLRFTAEERRHLDQLCRDWIGSAGQLAAELAEREIDFRRPGRPWRRSAN